MIAAIVFFTALMTCAMSSFLLCQRANKRSTNSANSNVQLIDSTLTLIQLLQKHRGLGSQQSGVVAVQREQIASEVDHRLRGSAIHAAELAYLQSEWSQLKRKPADFDGHSALIKHLLGIIEILANRVSGDAHDARSIIADRCRALEDLARLRGLSTRAAQFPQCPIELKVQLKYLCENLHGSDLQRDRSTLRIALKEINEQMLDAVRTTISPTRCFDMLTPIVDSALSEIRSSIHALRPSRSAPLRWTAPLCDGNR